MQNNYNVDEIEDVNSSKSLEDYNIMDLFEELSFKEKWQKVSQGLKEPHDSGDYKWAKLQILRLYAPLASVVVPIIMLLIIGILAAIKPVASSIITVTVMEVEQVEELKDIEEIIPPDPPEPVEVDPSDIIAESPYAGADPNATPGPITDFSPVPTTFDAVAIVKSPVIMRNMYGSRTPGQRGSLLAGGGGGGPTEAAVLMALRWLKTKQNSDGSWDKTKPAMTGLALLCYLAHAETPSSEEFGFTVEMAIKWLLDNQNPDGSFKGRDGHDYSHPIAAYALAEAYGMTMIPDIKYAAEKAVDRIIKGQHPTGAWDYNLKQSQRRDTSYMAWCAQAIKAAQIAQLDCEGLDKASKLSIKGFQTNFAGNYDKGGFGYTSPSRDHGLTACGVLCIQLHGGSKMDEVMGGLKTMQEGKWLTYDIDNPFHKSSLYYWYYATQAMFHEGGEVWNKWNRLFSPELVRKQHIISKETSNYVDHKGMAKAIGFWDQYGGSGSNENPVFPTTLCALQLMVYYRNLPTFKVNVQELQIIPENNDKIKIDIQM